ncbi:MULTISPECIES: FRG domain-containing protein [Bacillus]|uniref:FRG domain-containing protein n=1 Tax=Bacillus TaxID=1386 RepID=UPI000BEFA58A|nr:FRG domain-containing protein [Bacillus mycoides]PEK86499.1 FRG domain-containing protein [Bacillus mycoides]HDR7635530.1 FRG domain-containing protein [Bacillus mycoides]
MGISKRYSKRELKGLPTPEEIIVEDLSSYIQLFSNGEFTNNYFRGEPTNYHNTISSGLRDVASNIGFNAQIEPNTEVPFLNMKKEFKREVWYKLSSDERMHFSAFSQHHGIPTNLIDITTSPLVALYFACQNFKNVQGGNDQFDEDKGFVYSFENKFVDITDVLAKFEDENILEVFAYDRNDIFIDMYNLFLKYESKYPIAFYNHFKNLIQEHHEYFSNYVNYNVPENLEPYNNGAYKLKIFDYIPSLIESRKLNGFYRQLEDVSPAVFLYTAYLQLFLNNILSFTTTIWWFNHIMPDFKYAPILTFERGRNQQGLFIYQTYLNYIEETYNTPVAVLQRVWPNKIIVINNKEKILKELDFMGINEKFIYGGYDHIASYIRNKFK